MSRLSLETMALIYVGNVDVMGVARLRTAYDIPVGAPLLMLALVICLPQMADHSRSHEHAAIKDHRTIWTVRVLKQN
jgi:hypothetical protein